MKLKLFPTLLIIAFLVIGYLCWLYLNLDIGESPQEADVIIVNEGDGPSRAHRGVELMLAGYAEKIIVSPPFGPNYNALEWYYEAGAEPDELIHEEQATSTWTNALYSIELMEENGWTSALVVSSDYHMRRVRLSYERAAQGKNLHFTYVSAYKIKDDQAIPYTQRGRGVWMALQELFKYPGYLLGLYHIIDL